MFSFRCRLPIDIAERLGRDCIVRTLKTDRVSVARYLSAGLALGLNELWASLHVNKSKPELAAAVAAWFTREVERVWRQYQAGPHAELLPKGATAEQARQINIATTHGDASNQLERLQEEYQSGDYDSAAPIARAIVRELESPFDEGDQRFTILKKRIVEALGDVEEARLRWSSGDDEYWPPSSSVDTADIAPVTRSEAATATIRDVALAYLDHRRAERRATPKAISQLNGQIETLLSGLGYETQVTDVTPVVAGQVFTAFRSLPSNFRKVDSLSRLTLFTAAKEARRLGLSPMNPKTVNNVMTTLRGVFREAQDQGLVLVNPFKGKHVSIVKTAGSDRGFTPEELDTMIAAPLFMGCERHGRPFQAGSFRLNDWRFWLPAVAMLSGARAAELCQLRREDVREDHGSLTLHLTSQGDKRLKTIHSARIVPVHDRLIHLGFRHYVDTRPLGSAIGSLFEIPIPANGNWSAKAGNWFREKFLSDTLGGARRDGLGLHSFRHNVETSMRAAGVRQDISHRLLGHKAADVAGGYGRYEVEAAKDAVMKIRVPDIFDRVPTRVA
jgi:integrase